MYKTGYVIENLETYIIDSALFDTGASSDNYISEAFVDKDITIFKPHILQHNSTVRLGDSKTTVHITHIITLNISFLDNNSITHQAVLNFSIMSMKLDMIIGINSILFSFFDLFLDMLKTAKALQLHHLKHNMSPTPHSSTLVSDFTLVHTVPTVPSQVSTNLVSNLSSKNACTGFVSTLVPELSSGSTLLHEEDIQLVSSQVDINTPSSSPTLHAMQQPPYPAVDNTDRLYLTPIMLFLLPT
jgi:hypothetical protein